MSLKAAKIIILTLVGVCLIGLTQLITDPSRVEAQSPTFVYGRDSSGNPLVLRVSATTGQLEVGGPAADGDAVEGNPVLVAGIDVAGNVARLNLHSTGTVALTNEGDSGSDGLSNARAEGVFNSSGNTAQLKVVPHFLNNAETWDRIFYCDASAVVTVAAGATTEIVALVSADIIRVCGFVLSMATTGTFQWVEGTGTDCGTGASDLTSDIDLVAGSAFSAYGNPEIFRNTVSEALCLTAVTGAVDGVVTFAQY